MTDHTMSEQTKPTTSTPHRRMSTTMKQKTPASPAAETAKHSPLPWHVEGPIQRDDKKWGNHIAIISSDENLPSVVHAYNTSWWDADSAMIVRAVNSEAALRAALERLIRVAGVELDKTRPDVMEESRRALSL